ncbi:MAG: type II secretion system minor pseudopilin GspK [Burkholderiales bacterium]
MASSPVPLNRSPRRQRGAALLTAMIIVTLVATLAAAMVWQQWRAVQVEAAERARTQSAWTLSAALDIARLYLREDQKNLARSGTTALTEPWATPLQESKLSTLLGVEATSTEDSAEAFLSGNITDAQGRYNLRNLITVVAKGQPDDELLAFGRLCETLGLDGSVAPRIATGLRSAAGATAAAPLWPETVPQLSWLGIDPSSIQALLPYVVMLPKTTPLNVNTASKEVLGAVIGDAVNADQLVKIAMRTPFKNVAALQAQVPGLTLRTAALDVKSSFFDVRGRIRLDDHVLIERSLVERLPNLTSKVWRRERIASLEQLGS